MNHVFSYAASLPQSFYSAFTKRLLPELTAQQKKLLIISSIAIGIITACVLAYRYCFRPNSPVVPNRNHNPHIHVNPQVSPDLRQIKHPRFRLPPDVSPKNSPKQPPNKDPFYNPSPKPVHNPSPKISPQHSPTKHSPKIVKVDTSQISPRTLAAISKAMLDSPQLSPKGQTQSPKSPQTIINPSPKPGTGGLTGSPIVNNPVVNKPVVNNPPPKPKAPRTDLVGMEADIRDLMDDLKTERDILGLLAPISPVKQDNQGQVPGLKKDDSQKDVKDEDVLDLTDERNDQIDEVKKKVAQLEADLQQTLKSYPTEFRKYLEDKFVGFNNKDFQDIFERVVKFSGYMDLHANNQAFIQDCLTQVDAFLTHAFFTSPTDMCLQEQKKTDLIVFNPFFKIVENHFKAIEKAKPQLATSLKVKLANLPLIDEINRSKEFPNVYLSEQDQLGILIDHFQNEEGKQAALVIQKIKNKGFNEKDVHRLSKLVSNKSSLSVVNQLPLRDALTKQMGSQAPANWNDSAKIENDLKRFFKPAPSHNNNPYGYNYNYNYGMGMGMGAQDEIFELRRSSKAREYFANQVGLSEDQVQIPRWYHATSYGNIKAIIESGAILRVHNQQYYGAWVSNQREPTMGDCVFVFNNRVTKIDPNVFIGYEKGKINWRGIQEDVIPLAGICALGSNHVANVHLMGYRNGGGGVNPKSEKAQILKDLSNQAAADAQFLNSFQNKTKAEQDAIIRDLSKKTITDGQGNVIKVNEKKIQVLESFQNKSKAEQARMIEDLSNKSYKHVTVVSVDQVDYLQRQVIKVIGNPNLPEKWFGQADVSKLDKHVAQPQLNG